MKNYRNNLSWIAVSAVCVTLLSISSFAQAGSLRTDPVPILPNDGYVLKARRAILPTTDPVTPVTKDPSDLAVRTRTQPTTDPIIIVTGAL